MDRDRSTFFRGNSKGWVSLGALGALCATGLGLALRGHDGAPPVAGSSTIVTEGTGSGPSTGAIRSAPFERPPRAMRAAKGDDRAGPTAGASRRKAEPRVSEEQKRLVATAHRELEQLEVQEPTNFLAVFDMMKEDGKGSEKAIEAGRRASHAYILARMRILEGMLRRFIDDPESDHALETEALARIDAEFREKLDALARDVPPMANLQEILTTTILKAPTFIDPNSEVD